MNNQPIDLTVDQIRARLRTIMLRCGAYIFLWCAASYYVVPLCLDLGSMSGRVAVLIYSLAAASHTVLTFATEYERAFCKKTDGVNNGQES